MLVLGVILALIAVKLSSALSSLPISVQSRDVEALVGRSAKVCVSAAAIYTLLTSATWRPAYIIGGGLLNGALSKVLKRSIRQSRPTGSTKKGYGMPSSHAQSLFYFATVLAIMDEPVLTPVMKTCAIIYAVVASSWRVTSGLHSSAQTAVGAILGCGMGHFIITRETIVLSGLGAGPSPSHKIILLTLCSVLVFSKEWKLLSNAINERLVERLKSKEKR
jgi:membrane-associated phospholipid phosphatase